ncbi:MAG: hypothetical protein KA941_06555 [Flavobacteriales bacterium]|nr:hypothetical protein [Flavobacteriales bacterium]
MYKVGPRSLIVVVLLGVFTAWALVQFRYIGVPGNDWHDAINSDGKGYYEYLRMFLFEGDANMHPGKGVLHPSIDAEVIKHLGGAAAFMSPFVLAAHVHTLLKTDPIEDGYSLHYQIAVGVSALTWLLVGLIALRRWLLASGITDGIVAIVLTVITLGTGLITQAVVHPAMSHVYGFATIALLMLHTRWLLLEPTARRLVGCAALLALATWIRPVNFLVVMALPLASFGASWNKGTLRALLRSKWMVVSALVFGAIVSLQGLLWFLQSGSFIVRPYPGEGFHWTRPAIAENLFSPRNGLFFYWPLLLLVVPGAVILWRKSRRQGAGLLMFLAAFGYVTAAWWNWAYGDNFGQRTFVDMLAVFALPIALAVPRYGGRRWTLLAISMLFILLNLFQSWQYLTNLLVTGQMDMLKYKHLFLTADPQHALAVGGHEDLPLYSLHGTKELMIPFLKRENPPATSGGYVTLLSAPLPSACIGVPLHLALDIERTETMKGSSADALIVLQLRRNGIMRRTHTWRMNIVPNAPTVAQWQYAFNLLGQEEGDTLVVGCTDGGTKWRADPLNWRATIPR